MVKEVQQGAGGTAVDLARERRTLAVGRSKSATRQRGGNSLEWVRVERFAREIFNFLPAAVYLKTLESDVQAELSLRGFRSLQLSRQGVLSKEALARQRVHGEPEVTLSVGRKLGIVHQALCQATNL